MTIFLLFGIVLFFGLLLIYTFKVIAVSGLVYLSLIPISFLHYQKIKKQNNIGVIKDENEDLEDIL
jgi:CDP-diacylglycerol--serine O-phosphatidyltransferase